MRDELPFSCHFVKLAPAACHVKVFLKEAGHSGAKSILNCKILFTMRVCLIWDSARMRDVLPFSCDFVKLSPAVCHVKVFLKEAEHIGAKPILK